MVFLSDLLQCGAVKHFLQRTTIMKTNYKLGSALAAILLAAPVLAVARTNHDSVSNSAFTGPYLGVYGGYDWTELDSDGGFDAELDGVDYGVFGGVRVDGLLDRVNGLGIGMNGAVEAFYGGSESDDSGVEKDEEWGVSFRPGMSFLDDATHSMGIAPYGVLGYRNTKFEATGGSERYDGFDLGIGAQLLSEGAVGLRAEYIHTWYGEEDGIDPDSDAVRVGLSYQF
jgi:outer membrane immunogenic protein